ncbi:acetolactate decarboxylase [Pontibacter mangrovi]|uniref:Alpha-acetolactate decarboxylase n=2 Tax=Pontibacter mangrovi TaxID=2589816 RepID=A0A501W4M9_9BACT|nr:acetolactate decarboxylase [Pontibacter mangrovi]
MKNVMRKGELFGTIDLDTISNKTHLYGLGPLEYLRGELLIVDGKAYKSTVLSDSTMQVEETFAAKAPFFVYANVANWQEHTLPDSVQTMPQLEVYLDEATKTATRPFAFRLKGTVQAAHVHIVNLPEDTKVSSPQEAHQGQATYTFQDAEAEIIGFYSTEHKAIFTHHDSNMHLHLITSDKSKMGHLDKVKFGAGSMKLYLPQE